MEPKELSIKEIHEYFLCNDYKVTNTQLVKYFRKFLTNNESISKFFVLVWLFIEKVI